MDDLTNERLSAALEQWATTAGYKDTELREALARLTEVAAQSHSSVDRLFADVAGQRIIEAFDRWLIESLSGDLEEPSRLQGLTRLAEAGRSQGVHAQRMFDRVVDTLLDDLDLRGSVPRAVVDQAHRVAARRRKLVAGGAWTVADLADVRGQAPGAVHTWLSRQRDDHRLFTVSDGGQVFVPALLLDEAAEPYAGTSRAIRPLVHAGMDSWALWVWFDTAAAALDGSRPAELLRNGPLDLLATTAERQAANAKGARTGNTDAA